MVSSLEVAFQSVPTGMQVILERKIKKIPGANVKQPKRSRSGLPSHVYQKQSKETVQKRESPLGAPQPPVPKALDLIATI